MISNGPTASETFKQVRSLLALMASPLQLFIFTRYLNSDYTFLKTLFATAVMLLVIFYGIACQWHKNLWEHMKIFPPEEALSPNVKSLLFLVPKFYLPAHVEACNLQFSFNPTKGVGRTDDEAPERGWANINPAAQSTKEIGQGSRSDMLDDHFGDWSWKQMVRLGKSFICLYSPHAGTEPLCLAKLY